MIVQYPVQNLREQNIVDCFTRKRIVAIEVEYYVLFA